MCVIGNGFQNFSILHTYALSLTAFGGAPSRSEPFVCCRFSKENRAFSSRVGVPRLPRRGRWQARVSKRLTIASDVSLAIVAHDG